MSTIEDQRKEYINNPYFKGHIYGDFSPFYVTITICAVVFVAIVVLNIVIGCCSKHRKYWQDRHTGNRWLVSIWSATPHKQPPLDLTELKEVTHYEGIATQPAPQVFEYDQYAEEEPIHSQHHLQRPPRPEGRGFQQQRQREEYVELHKRESDI